MRNTVYRSVTAPRRCPAPRPAGSSGFSSMLAKLRGASIKLNQARPRKRV